MAMIVGDRDPHERRGSSSPHQVFDKQHGRAQAHVQVLTGIQGHPQEADRPEDTR